MPRPERVGRAVVNNSRLFFEGDFARFKRPGFVLAIIQVKIHWCDENADRSLVDLSFERSGES